MTLDDLLKRGAYELHGMDFARAFNVPVAAWIANWIAHRIRQAA